MCRANAPCSRPGYGGGVVTVDELTIADEPGAWAALGFAVAADECQIGEVRLRFAGAAARGEAPSGLLGWSLREVGSTELDGLPTGRSERPLPGPPPAHPNRVAAVDHVVAITPALERTVAALQAAGLDLRRIREEPTPAGAPRQAFFRLGPTILEVVEEPADVAARNGPERDAFFWGLALAAPEIEASVAAIGAGEVRDAVQPGRRIASLGRAAGLALPVALITPPPRVERAGAR